VGAAPEAPAPTLAALELRQPHEQLVGGCIQVCSQFGDLITQPLQFVAAVHRMYGSGAGPATGVAATGVAATGINATGTTATGTTATGTTATGTTATGIAATGIAATGIAATGIAATGIAATGITATSIIVTRAFVTRVIVTRVIVTRAFVTRAFVTRAIVTRAIVTRAIARAEARLGDRALAFTIFRRQARVRLPVRGGLPRPCRVACSIIARDPYHGTSLRKWLKVI
jgi:hypothetical protein